MNDVLYGFGYKYLDGIFFSPKTIALRNVYCHLDIYNLDWIITKISLLWINKSYAGPTLLGRYDHIHPWQLKAERLLVLKDNLIDIFQVVQSKEQLIEALLVKNNTLTQENAALRLQLQRTLGTRGPVNATPQPPLQTENLHMIDYIRVLHGEQDSLKKRLKEQQDIVESLKKELTDLRSKVRCAQNSLGSI